MHKMRQGDYKTHYFKKCYFKKCINEVKASDLQLSFNIFQQPSTWDTIKANCIMLLLIQRYSQL